MAKYSLDLQQSNNKRTKRKAALIIAFICFVIILGTVSTLLLWRSYDYDFNNMFIKQDESTTSAPSTTDADSVTYSGNYEFLIAVTSDDKKQVLFFNMVCVDMSEKVIRVIPVDDGITDSVTGKTCSELLVSNGISSTVDFFNSFYGIEIERYVLLTEGGYKSFFRTMGDITIQLEKEVEYDTADMFLELNRGENVLSPDKTYKYMKYICETYDGYERSKLNAEIVVAAFSSFYNVERFNSADSIFSVVIDYCQTNITIVDFTNTKDELQYLLPQTSKEKLKVFVSDNVNYAG